MLCYSEDDERFHDVCESVEQAIEIARQNGWDAVYVGKKYPLAWRELLACRMDLIVNDIVYEAECSAFEAVGEPAEGWPYPDREATEALRESLLNTIETWANKYDQQPKFFAAYGVKCHDVPDEQESSDREGACDG